MKKLFILILVVLLGAIAVYTVTQSKPENETEVEQEENILPSVEVWNLERDQATPAVFSYGVVEAVHEVQLSFDASGEIQYVLAEPGQTVRKGQTLAILKNDAMAAQVNQAAASYAATQRQVEANLEGATDETLETARSQLKVANEQYETLIENDLTTDLELLMQKEVVRQADLRLKSLEQGMSGLQREAQYALLAQAASGLQYAMTLYDGVVLKAPFSGELLDWTLQEGQTVQPGMTVGSITDTHHVEIVTYLSDKEARRIRVGSMVSVDDEATGTVLGISSRISLENGKRKVRIMLSDSPFTLNQTVQLSIQEGSNPSEPLIPLSSVEVDREGYFVYAVENGVLVRTPIQILELQGEWARSQGSIPSVFALRAHGLTDGTHVEILP